MCFSDDIAIVSVAKTVKKLENTNIAIRKVGVWLDEAGLTLSAHITEAERQIFEKLFLGNFICFLNFRLKKVSEGAFFHISF